MKLFAHVFNSESKSVTFAWFALTIPAHLFFFLRPEAFKVEHWMAAQAMAAGLVGVKSIKEGAVAHAELTANKEVPANAPVPAAAA